MSENNIFHPSQINVGGFYKHLILWGIWENCEGRNKVEEGKCKTRVLFFFLWQSAVISQLFCRLLWKEEWLSAISFDLGVFRYVGLMIWPEGWEEKIIWELAEKYWIVPDPKQTKNTPFFVTSMTVFLIYSLPLLYEHTLKQFY